ncbi:MAG: RHS repeat-associated core domain-containing protein [Pseudomonadota bacterium]
MLDLSFTYDLASNITGITDGVSAARSQTFTYDSLSRLTEATGLYGTIDYAYDLVGNRTSRVVDEGGSVGTEAYAYASGTHRLASMTRTGAGAVTRSMSYAASGQLTSETRGGTSYSYTIDDAGRMSEALQGAASLAASLYDAFEQRVSKTTPSAAIHYVHDLSGRLIAEHDGATGDALREYIYIGLLPVGFIDHSGTSPVLYFVHADQVMNPLKLTDGSAVTVWDRVATHFGEEYLVGGSLTQPLRFPGQTNDSETELFQNWHREYDPALGRYVQSDPIGLLGGINTYVYVGGNPLTQIDPTGELGFAGAAYGAVAGGVGGYISSGGSVTGTLYGAVAGLAVGAVAPTASGAAGAALSALASGGASIVGQAAGNYAAEKDLLDRCNYDLTAALGAAAGGALAAPLVGAIRFGNKFPSPIVGRPHPATVAGPTIGTSAVSSVAEGAVVGTGELIGSKF